MKDFAPKPKNAYIVKFTINWWAVLAVAVLTVLNIWHADRQIAEITDAHQFVLENTVPLERDGWVYDPYVGDWYPAQD